MSCFQCCDELWNVCRQVLILHSANGLLRAPTSWHSLRRIKRAGQTNYKVGNIFTLEMLTRSWHIKVKPPPSWSLSQWLGEFPGKYLLSKYRSVPPHVPIVNTTKTTISAFIMSGTIEDSDPSAQCPANGIWNVILRLFPRLFLWFVCYFFCILEFEVFM